MSCNRLVLFILIMVIWNSTRSSAMPHISLTEPITDPVKVVAGVVGHAAAGIKDNGNAGFKRRDEEQQRMKEAREAEIAASARVDALKPKVQLLNSFLPTITAAAAYVNSVKNLSANFLDDNQSVSSIPRNYQALSERHMDFLSSYLSRIDALKSTIMAVIDSPSYTKARNKIAEFQSNCSSDDALISAEGRFLSDIGAIGRSLDHLASQGNQLSQSLSIDKFKDLVDQRLVASVGAANKSVLSYRAVIDAVTAIVDAQRDRRRVLCSDMPRAYSQLADAQLRRANVAAADELIASIDTTLRGPRIYFMINAEILNARYAIDHQIDDLSSPIHAKRALYGAKSLVNDLRGTVSGAKLSDDMKRNAENIIDQFEASLRSRETHINKELLRKEYHAKERQRLTKISLLHAPKDFTSTCKDLANLITNDKDPVSTISEEHYARYDHDCQK